MSIRSIFRTYRLKICIKRGPFRTRFWGNKRETRLTVGVLTGSALGFLGVNPGSETKVYSLSEEKKSKFLALGQQQNGNFDGFEGKTRKFSSPRKQDITNGGAAASLVFLPRNFHPNLGPYVRCAITFLDVQLRL